MSVDDMIDDIIRREGGYVNHPADRGGPTKYGITLYTLANWKGPGVTADDVAALDLETARAIYREHYYIIPRIDQLPPAIQPFMFDAAVNHGPKRAVQMLQGALGVKEDGIIGPKTIGAAERFLLNRLISARCKLYYSIVRNDPSQRVFLKGWLNRLAEFAPDAPTHA